MKLTIFALLPCLALAEIRGEFIYETAPFPSCHASTIVEIAPGELLASWFGGTDEGKPDVAIWAARRTKGKWSTPVELAREQNTATYNPVLFYSQDKTLWLYYKFGRNPEQWSAARRSSRDGGRTWSAIEYLPAGILGPIKNKPLVLKDGVIVSGTSVESHRAWTSWVERSTDHGKSWIRHGPMNYPPTVNASIQPAIVPLAGNRLRAFVRTQDSLGRIAYSDSADAGKTWSDLKLTDLPNPNSGIDAVGLKDGRIVLVYNHTTRGRTPLNLAVSAGGDQWKQFATLETEPGEFSYPAIIQAANGDVHVTYTWNRKKIKYVAVPLADIR